MRCRQGDPITPPPSTVVDSSEIMYRMIEYRHRADMAILAVLQQSVPLGRRRDNLVADLSENVVKTPLLHGDIEEPVLTLAAQRRARPTSTEAAVPQCIVRNKSPQPALTTMFNGEITEPAARRRRRPTSADAAVAQHIHEKSPAACHERSRPSTEIAIAVAVPRQSIRAVQHRPMSVSEHR